MLRLSLRASLRKRIAEQVEASALSRAGRLTACGIGAAALILLSASALDMRLGLPTFLAGTLTACVVLIDQS